MANLLAALFFESFTFLLFFAGFDDIGFNLLNTHERQSRRVTYLVPFRPSADANKVFPTKQYTSY